MAKGRINLAIALLGIITLLITSSIGLAATAGYLTYLPIVYRYSSPTPTRTPTPTKTPSISPTPTRTSTPTQAPPPPTGNVAITSIFYDGTGQNEPDEYVEIKNNDTYPIQLSNWTLRDDANHIFTFPSFVIQPGQVCRVYTNENHPEWCGFNYHSGTAIWNNTGDCGYLRDSANTLKSQLCY